MITADDLDVLINTKDTAEILGVARTNVPYYVRKGRLPVAQKERPGNGGGSWFRKGDALKLREELEAEAPIDCPLSRVLRDSCQAYYLALPDLTVMSRQKDPYRRATKAGRRDGEWFAEQISKFIPGDGTVHLRGMHYILVAKSGIFLPDGTEYVNYLKCFKFLEAASQDARWLGLVPFERIRDERNERPRIYLPGYFGSVSKHWSIEPGYGAAVPTLDEAMPALVNGALTDNPEQPYRICMIGEKSSLADVLAPIAASVQGELLLPTGELSDTMIAECEARAAEDGRPLVVLYFSDFDPSGYGMPITCARKLQALRTIRNHEHLDIQVHTVALTREQVETLNLPSTVLKDSEQRKDKWIAAMEWEQTEIDALCALQPEVLREIALNAVKPFYDFTLQDRWREAYEEWGWETRERFKAQSVYPRIQASIESHLENLRGRAAALKSAQEYWATWLNVVPPEDFVEPQPEINYDPPEPLFTTDDDFRTATEKLKACRGYDLIDFGSEEPESE